METLEANLVEENDEFYLRLSLFDDELKIPLTEDRPNNVKEVFNQLILKLKEELFEFHYVGEKEDLYSLVCKEYISKLNSELVGIHNELDEYGLLKLKEE